MSNLINGEVDSWIEVTKKCQYLPENALKVSEWDRKCQMVSSNSF